MDTVLAITVILLCVGCVQTESHSGELTEVMPRGSVRITSDGHTVLAVGQFGTILQWDVASERLIRRKTSIEQIWNVLSLPGTQRVLLRVYHYQPGHKGAEPREWHELRWWDLCTSSSEGCIVVPAGPPVGCWVNPTTVALSCYEDFDSLRRSSVIILFRLDGARATNLYTFRHPLGNYCAAGVLRIDNRTVLIHLRLHSKDQVPDCDSSELIVLDVASKRLLARVRTEIDAEGMWQTAVADGGLYCAVRGRGRIEVRSLPDLSLVKSVDLGGTNHVIAGNSIAISPNARYLALGTERLELVEIASGKIHLLDKMNEYLVNSQLRLAPEPFGELGEALVRAGYCVATLRFVGDGGQLAAITHDGVFTLWDCSTRTCLRRAHILATQDPMTGRHRGQ